MAGYLKVISGVDNTGVIASCVESYREWNAHDPTYAACPTDNGSTVESLFKKIEDAITADKPTHVKYDSYYVVPKSIFIFQGDSSEIADAVSGSAVTVEFAFPIP